MPCNSAKKVGNSTDSDASRKITFKVGYFHTFVSLFKKEMLQELRTYDMLSSMGFYSFLVIIIFGATLALTAKKIDILQISGGLIWVLIVFTSLLGLGRSFSREYESGGLEGVLLAPIDRSAIFLSKAMTNLIFMLIVEAITVPLFFFFFLSGEVLSPTVFLFVFPLLVGTIGIAGVGTLLSTITSKTRSKELLLAVLFVPLIYPLLYGCVSATTAAIAGTELWTEMFVVPMVIVCGYDIIMFAVSWLFYDFVVSS